MDNSTLSYLANLVIVRNHIITAQGSRNIGRKYVNDLSNKINELDSLFVEVLLSGELPDNAFPTPPSTEKLAEKIKADQNIDPPQDELEEFSKLMASAEKSVKGKKIKKV